MPAKPNRKARARPSALVRAEHGEPPVHLTAPQRTVLEEALRRSEDLREELESTLSAYGRWLLGAVFKNDAAAALENKTDNPVWVELVRRAGGPTLRVSRRLLYVALSVAAHDKRITDQAWRNLDAGRKELLLPLGDDAALRKGAHHVASFNLTQSKTREYVSEVLSAQGAGRQVRFTAPQLLARVAKLRATFDNPSGLRRFGELKRGLEPQQREQVAEELDKLRDLLSELSKTLRAKR
jgi:hypothetical protein